MRGKGFRLKKTGIAKAKKYKNRIYLRKKVNNKNRKKKDFFPPLSAYKAKTLKSHLLKKLSIKFFETQDLSSTHGKPKLLFYDYSCKKIFPGNRRGEL